MALYSVGQIVRVRQTGELLEVLDIFPIGAWPDASMIEPIYAVGVKNKWWKTLTESRIGPPLTLIPAASRRS